MKLYSTWPELDYGSWKDTCQTLHRWIQIVGKIRLARTPRSNHSWNSTLYVTERGLTTSVIHDLRHSFSLELDFVDHLLHMRRSDGEEISIPLVQEAVSSFYGRCMRTLAGFGIEPVFHGAPNELADATPFAQDDAHRTYDPRAAHRFWLALLKCDQVMKEFRSRFVGKCSPVHLFWGSLDLAVTRFSGRRAPAHPGGVPHLPDLIARDAYSHEVSSCGFWPGSEAFAQAAFYSYAYPAPEGFEKARVPKGAFYEPKLREFVLPYERIRESSAPEAMVLEFFEATYEAAARLGNWDRELLERSAYLDALRAPKFGLGKAA